MVVHFHIEHSFPYPWKFVSAACWFKFPDPAEPRVRVETVSHAATPGHVNTTRKFLVDNDTPLWVRKLFGVSVVEFEETMDLDASQSQLKISTRNVTFASILETTETSSYIVHPDNKSWTFFQQDGAVTAHVGFLSGPVERFCANIFKAESLKSHHRMESRLEQKAAMARSPEKTAAFFAHIWDTSSHIF
jgi:hypothetical protein